MKDDEVRKKCNSLIADLAERTGESEKSVANVLNELGLLKSIKHRVYVDDMIGSSDFDNVNVDSLRVSSGGAQV